MRDELRSLLPASSEDIGGRLRIGGCDVGELCKEFGTPLYIYDAATIRSRAADILSAFADLGARVSFASKACALVAVLQLVHSLGPDVDVVSGGELEAVRRAGFSAGQVHFHGNYKTDAELAEAVRLGLHAIVLDNIEEIDRLERIARSRTSPVPVMLRLALPIEARTHPHLQTSGYRAKFGLYRGSEEEAHAYERLSSSPVLSLIGIHAHVGSQIADAGIYAGVAETLCGIAVELLDRGFPLREVSCGGGWAVPYAPGDPALSPRDVASAVAPAFRRHPDLRLAVEPGRALIAPAAVAVYTVGSVKRFGDGRVISVDGGMGDNPRPALYGARYTAVAPERMDEPATGPADIAGRYCESGDMLARDTSLPRLDSGDLVMIPVAGAYQISMASGYNLVPPPAAVLVQAGHAQLVQRRATVDDLLSRDSTAK